MAGMSEGTCTRYRCRGCGEEWTWRNTQEGRNAYARTNRQHDGELVPVGTEYRGRHRADEGGDPWPAMLPAEHVEPIPTDPPAEYTDATHLRPQPGAQWVDHEGQPITNDER